MAPKLVIKRIDRKRCPPKQIGVKKGYTYIRRDGTEAIYGNRRDDRGKGARLSGKTLKFLGERRVLESEIASLKDEITKLKSGESREHDEETAALRCIISKRTREKEEMKTDHAAEIARLSREGNLREDKLKARLSGTTLMHDKTKQLLDSGVKNLQDSLDKLTDGLLNRGQTTAGSTLSHPQGEAASSSEIALPKADAVLMRKEIGCESECLAGVSKTNEAKEKPKTRDVLMQTEQLPPNHPWMYESHDGTSNLYHAGFMNGRNKEYERWILWAEDESNIEIVMHNTPIHPNKEIKPHRPAKDG